ncbi:hypothetical protein DENIT_70020 [Pseudomonas veronii]|uniref:hypothetical protein n=1 Tax=Pseudomonas veronii TaxID=76761 RepID=UPI00177A593D|nr:hypothetical protein [Pseudomonas veronii]CAD0266043.1 hypothetical protein DENIT_70020 [Pseudomonas veronii]
MAKPEPLQHRSFVLLYVVGVLIALLLVFAWNEASSTKQMKDYFVAAFVTVITVAGPLQAISVAFVVTLNKSGRVSRFKALRTVARK